MTPRELAGEMLRGVIYGLLTIFTVGCADPPPNPPLPPEEGPVYPVTTR